MRFHVTREDIDLGRPSETASCPVARALARGSCIPLPSKAFTVTVLDIYFYGPTGGSIVWRRDPPEEVARFVAAFDARQHVDPFSFDLDIPDSAAPAPSQGGAR